MDSDPSEFVPATDLGSYRELLDSPLFGILNERRVLRRGTPIQGLLCGYSYQPVPEISGPFASAKLSLKDDVGSQIVLRINMAVVRLYRTESQTRPDPARRTRLSGG